MIFKYAVKKGKKKYLVDLDDIVYMKNPKKFIPPKDIHAEYAKCLNMTSKLMQLAMRLQHHIFLRSGEIMSLEWEHVKNSMLEIPAELMKMDQPHKVPLSTHAKKIIEEIKKFTGSEKFLFPSSSKTGHLTGDALSKAFREHQIPYYPHRCRTIAGSWFKNKSIAAPYIVEIQLSHKTKSKVQESYEVEAHDFFLKERKIMMQKWSDFLESPTQEKPELETIEINSDPYIISEKLIKFV
jgi:integrase